MVDKLTFKIINKYGKPINGDASFPVEEGKYPVIFILHGFKGYKDWGFFPYLGEKITNSRAITICFNFSLNGMEDGSDLVASIDDFANNTVKSEIEDIEFLIDAFEKDEFEIFKNLKKNWNGEIYLLGHSLGGGVSILAAAKMEQIKKIALWATVGVFDRYTPRQKEIWKKQGYMEFVNQRTGQMLKMNVSFLEDIEKHKTEYDLNRTISSLKIPVLIVHGSEDLTIPIKEVNKLADSANKDAIDYYLINHTGHTFGAEHPFLKTTPALEEAIEKTINFYGL